MAFLDGFRLLRWRVSSISRLSAMAWPQMITLTSLIDDAKGYELIRFHRWPEGIRCTRCSSAAVVRHGHDQTQRYRQRYRCKDCGARFDDLTGTVLAGHHQPLRVWVLCLYVMALNRSNRQSAGELSLNDDDAHDMASHRRRGLVAKVPEATLEGDVEADAVDVVAGHKGNPAAVPKKVGPGGVDGSKEHAVVARSKRRSQRSWA
jgi:transposase-like protein